jgi:predicted membrane protein
MAINRYDLRKNYEEAEANAIGTEFSRADLLAPADGRKVQALLRQYLEQRKQFYAGSDAGELAGVDTRTAQLQGDLWAAVTAPAAATPNPVTALVVAGMNDVLNSQGYTQAAWWNRIPHAAWALMLVIAVCANVLIGYGARSRNATQSVLLLILPAIASIAFTLIADIDSPRGGLIRLQPRNIVALSEALSGR